MSQGPDATVLLSEAETVESPESVAPAKAGLSPTQIALARLRKDKLAWASVVVIVFFVLVAIFQDLITKIVGVNGDTDQTLLDPNTTLPMFTATAAHPFGVQPQTGQDLFYEWAHGARPSLIVGIGASLLTMIIGVVLGLLAGFLGGWVDRVISWVIDFLLSLPFLLMAIALVPVALARFGHPDGSGYIQPGREAAIRFASLIFVLVAFSWPGLARLIRGATLSLREQEFVQAARSLGQPTWRVVMKEMLPNLTGPIIVNLTVLIPAFIAAEAGLSFLGAGLKAPIVSWGQTIAAATGSFDTYPIWLWIPVASIALLVLALSLFGDAVSDAFNPATRR
ncbi:ABC transporter permease [Rudaeicoccus suwonensis]|uniref:Peptide/nickel transport system permease protein/oligopeptide transport system permease protein n=1 Tax=Rudaeicoccus suwonensis TaxID=657409 RepID=A0A561EA82_9MICO|nr:ABC transporter permease [Rudaeicoccus suwonensis]TWE12503.1 peptide/nickel transport system permease protein/oligopeptide transport system permease protein [Rudaeicoccus suwonensis]